MLHLVLLQTTKQRAYLIPFDIIFRKYDKLEKSMAKYKCKWFEANVKSIPNGYVIVTNECELANILLPFKRRGACFYQL